MLLFFLYLFVPITSEFVPVGKLVRDRGIYGYERFDNVVRFNISDVHFNNNLLKYKIQTLKEHELSLVRVKGGDSLNISEKKTVKKFGVVILFKKGNAYRIDYYDEKDTVVENSYSVPSGSAILVSAMRLKMHNTLNLFADKNGVQCVKGFCRALSDNVFFYDRPISGHIHENYYVDSGTSGVTMMRFNIEELNYQKKFYAHLKKGDALFSRSIFLNLYGKILKGKKTNFGVADEDIDDVVKDVSLLRESTSFSYDPDMAMTNGVIYIGTTTTGDKYHCIDTNGSSSIVFKISRGSCFNKIEFDFHRFSYNLIVGVSIGTGKNETYLTTSNRLVIYGESIREMRFNVPICTDSIVFWLNATTDDDKFCIPGFDLIGPAYNHKRVYRYN